MGGEGGVEGEAVGGDEGRGERGGEGAGAAEKETQGARALEKADRLVDELRSTPRPERLWR